MNLIDEQNAHLTSTPNSTSSISSSNSCLSPTQNGTNKSIKPKGFTNFPIKSFLSNNNNASTPNNSRNTVQNKVVSKPEIINRLFAIKFFLKDRLNEKLAQYSVELPTLPSDIQQCLNNYESSLDIKQDWNSVVGDAFAQSLTVQQARQQMAIWELFTTEVSYIKLTKVIINVCNL